MQISVQEDVDLKFRVFISIVCSPKTSLEHSIATYLKSDAEDGRMWGVLGILVKFQIFLAAYVLRLCFTAYRPNKNREEIMKECLDKLDGATKDSQSLRAFYFEELARIFDKSRKCTESHVVVL